jgi:PAS domain S-box-containing protein
MLSLNRLINRRQAQSLLKDFEALAPGISLAIVTADGAPFAGSLPDSARDLVGALSEAKEDRMIHRGPWTLAPLYVDSKLVGGIVGWAGVRDATRVTQVLTALRRSLGLLLSEAMEKRAIAHETLERYREINLLYNIGETIGASLDPEEIPLLALAEANRAIHSDAELIALLDPQQPAKIVFRATSGEAESVAALQKLVSSSIELTRLSGQPAILTELLVEPLGSLLCVPLKTQERVNGAILLARLKGSPIFTAGEEKLLMALASQAATAVENARLFANVKLQRDAIAEMKSYMDSIFASIASGVITTDVRDQITTLNRAAEQILAVHAPEAMGKHYADALPKLGEQIVPLINRVRRDEQQVTGYEMEPELPSRGHVVLRLHISPLKDSQQVTNGVAIVLDDLTEHRQLEAQVRQVRRTFERYVAPQVVEQLLSDPVSVQLGGVRQEVTTFFADIRGFTSFSEQVEPEVQIEVLNRHLTLAAEAVLKEEGTLDKFVGDAVMAIFNVPLAQPDHVLRAVRAGLVMQRAVAEMHSDISPGERLSFGIGIATGPAVVGNIGSTTIQNYTAIGNSVNMAQRLQALAEPGQILLNRQAYERVKNQVTGRELGYIQLKGHSEPDLVFDIIG